MNNMCKRLFFFSCHPCFIHIEYQIVRILSSTAEFMEMMVEQHNGITVRLRGDIKGQQGRRQNEAMTCQPPSKSRLRHAFTEGVLRLTMTKDTRHFKLKISMGGTKFSLIVLVYILRQTKRLASIQNRKATTRRNRKAMKEATTNTIVTINSSASKRTKDWNGNLRETMQILQMPVKKYSQRRTGNRSKQRRTQNREDTR